MKRSKVMLAGLIALVAVAAVLSIVLIFVFRDNIWIAVAYVLGDGEPRIRITAADGTVTTTLNPQLAPAITLPPMRVNTVFADDPTRTEPGPQGGSGVGGRMAVRPEMAAERSSEKLMAVASTLPVVLSRVNASVAGPPAITG